MIKLSAIVRNGLKFDGIIEHLTEVNLHGKRDGFNLVDSIMEYFDDINFPCDSIIINPWQYSNTLVLTFKQKEELVLWLEIIIDKSCMFKINGFRYGSDDIKRMFHDDVVRFINKENLWLLESMIVECGLSMKDNNAITIDKYDDYKKTDESITLTGTLDEIFDKYTDMNESYKYCNGTYFKFQDEEIGKVYNAYTQCHKDYFLLSAVRHGRLID